MTTYDTPDCPLVLADYVAPFGSAFYDGFAADREAKRVMSKATHDVVERVLGAWLKGPGVMDCKLGAANGMLEVWLNNLPGSDEHLLAYYRVPLRDVVLAAAATSLDYEELPPSSVSNLLRALADEIDTGA